MSTDASLTKCGHDVYAEKWHPTNEKHSHYNANCDGRLVIGYMIRWWMMQMTYFKFLLWLSANASISILLFFHHFTANSGPSHGSYRFYMLLCITIQSATNGICLVMNVCVCLCIRQKDQHLRKWHIISSSSSTSMWMKRKKEKNKEKEKKRAKNK